MSISHVSLLGFQDSVKWKDKNRETLKTLLYSMLRAQLSSKDPGGLKATGFSPILCRF